MLQNFDDIQNSDVGDEIATYILKCHDNLSDINISKIQALLHSGGFASSEVFANMISLQFLQFLFPAEVNPLISATMSQMASVD